MQGVKCDTLQEDSMRCATSACVQQHRDERIMLVPIVTYHVSCRYCFKDKLPHMYPRKIHLLSPWGASLPVSSPLRRFKRLNAFVSTLWPVNANTAPLIKVPSSFGHLFDNIEVAENIHFLLHIKIHVILPFFFFLTQSLCAVDMENWGMSSHGVVNSGGTNHKQALESWFRYAWWQYADACVRETEICARYFRSTLEVSSEQVWPDRFQCKVSNNFKYHRSQSQSSIKPLTLKHKICIYIRCKVCVWKKLGCGTSWLSICKTWVRASSHVMCNGS